MATPYGRNFSGAGNLNYVRINPLIVAAEHSFSFWISCENATASSTEYIFSTNNPFESYAWISNNDDILFQGKNSGEFVTATDEATVAYKHVAITVENATIKIYVNGVLIDSDTISYSASNDIESLAIGGYIGSNDHAIAIADFRVYESVLSLSEVQGIHSNGLIDSSPLTTDLIGRWFLADNDVLDKSGNGNHGVKVGTTQGTTNGLYVPPPVVPTANTPSVENIGKTNFNADWSLDEDNANYRLDVATDVSFTSYVTGYEDLEVDSAPFNVNGLTADTDYWYRVRGSNSTGDSANSNVIALTTALVSPDINADLREFYLSSSGCVTQLETIELSHPDFSSSYFFVRNNTAGIEAALTDGGTLQEFGYLPMSITEQGSSTDLDYSLLIELGDLGETLPDELDAIIAADGLFTEPLLTYRSYSSLDLTNLLVGPVELKIKSWSFNKTGLSFTASGDQTNSQKTGEIYTINRFPMLRAFL